MSRSLCAAALLFVAALSVRALGTGQVEGTVHSGQLPAKGAVVFLVSDQVLWQPPPQAPVVIDQVELRFVPQVVAVIAGTTVAFPNSDPILHNVFSPRGPSDGFNLGTYPPGETRSHRFTDPGVHVILCHVHPEMVAYVAVLETPHNAVVDSAGRFVIHGVPPGRYTLHVWQARRAALQRDIAVADGATVRLELQLSR